MHADDIDTALLLKDFRSLTRFELIDFFEKGTGAKLNRSETEAMWLGAWKFCNDEAYRLTWVRKMKIMSVVFGVDNIEQDNWQPKLDKYYVVNYRAIITLVIGDVKCRIKLDSFRLSGSRFMDYWVCGNFCIFSNGTVNINL